MANKRMLAVLGNFSYGPLAFCLGSFCTLCCISSGFCPQDLWSRRSDLDEKDFYDVGSRFTQCYTFCVQMMTQRSSVNKTAQKHKYNQRESLEERREGLLMFANHLIQPII